MTVYERREEMLNDLAVRRFMTAPEQAARFGVSVQTIWNDFQDLSHDYPLEILRGRSGGIRVMDGCYIYRGRLTPKEEDLLKRLYSDLQGEDKKTMEGILKKHTKFNNLQEN